MEDTLFFTTPVAPASGARDPVVVVGLPRSGSSFLSHVLSQIPDFYVFDDLYLLDRARELGAEEEISPQQLHELLFFLGWQIRARLRFGTYAVPHVAEEEVERMNAALAETFADSCPSVLELQEEWMIRLAHRSGARNWGFKMPKAFREIDRLRMRYPNLKVIFLMRQPQEVLASYKHMPKTSQDGDPARYHPLAYAYYWRMAARSLLEQRSRSPENVLFVDFRHLTQAPDTAARQIAAFLGEVPPEQVSVPERPNSSHAGARKRPEITGLENWIINRLCGPEIAALGFAERRKDISPADFLDLLRVTGRFARFHLWESPMEKRRYRKVVRDGISGEN